MTGPAASVPTQLLARSLLTRGRTMDLMQITEIAIIIQAAALTAWAIMHMR